MNTKISKEEFERIQKAVSQYEFDQKIAFASLDGNVGHWLSIDSTVREHGPSFIKAEGMKTINAAFTPVTGFLRDILRTALPKGIEPLGLSRIKGGASSEPPTHELDVIVIDDHCALSTVVLSAEIPYGFYRAISDAIDSCGPEMETSAAFEVEFNAAHSQGPQTVYGAGYDSGYEAGYQAGIADGSSESMIGIAIRADSDAKTTRGSYAEFDAPPPTQSSGESGARLNADSSLEATDLNAVHDPELYAAHDDGFSAGYDVGYKAGHDVAVYAMVCNAFRGTRKAKPNEDTETASVVPLPAQSSEKSSSTSSGSESLSLSEKIVNRLKGKKRREPTAEDAAKEACDTSADMEIERAVRH